MINKFDCSNKVSKMDKIQPSVDCVDCKNMGSCVDVASSTVTRPAGASAGVAILFAIP